MLELADGQSSPGPALPCSTSPCMLLPAVTCSSHVPAVRRLQQQYDAEALQLAGDQRANSCIIDKLCEDVVYPL